MRQTLLTSAAIALVVAIILYVVFTNTRTLEGYLGLELNPAPLDYSMSHNVFGATGGYKLKYNPTKWDYLYNTPVAQGDKRVVVQGTPVPLAYEERPSTLPSESMFIFQNAVSAPECCDGATWSSSTGCLCVPSWQQWQIGYTRGGNSQPPGEYPFL